MEQIIAALIGGFLAAGTGWFLQTRLEKARANKLREVLTIGICDDLNHSISLYEKIEEEWNKTSIVWFSTLDELVESRQIYKENKNWIVLFEDADLRKKIFNYYLKSAQKISTLNSQQSRKYELEGKLNNLISKLKIDANGMEHEEAKALALSYMTEEEAEYIRLQNLMPGTVGDLFKLKAESKELISLLCK